MSFTTLILVALATWQVVEIWHHGSIFSAWRSHALTWKLLTDVGSDRFLRRRWKRTRRFLARLLGCPFCLSPWVGIILTVVFLVPYGWIPVAGLAAARLANLFNDVSHCLCRTPNRRTS